MNILKPNGSHSRAIGDAGSAVNYFEESIEFLSQLQTDELEVINVLLMYSDNACIFWSLVLW